jgi:hypothetical protein
MTTVFIKQNRNFNKSQELKGQSENSKILLRCLVSPLTSVPYCYYPIYTRPLLLGTVPLRLSPKFGFFVISQCNTSSRNFFDTNLSLQAGQMGTLSVFA